MSLKSTGEVIQCQQGGHEWFQLRCGRVTASEIVSVLAFLKRGDKKGGDTQKRKDYKTKIVSEILTGQSNMDGYLTPAMMHGADYEDEARTEYLIKTGNSVDRIGFVIHPTILRSGSSPDGFIGDDGGLEIKCPNSTTHIEYMMEDVIPAEYEPQMMFNMACSGRQWWDFVSYDPRTLERHQVFTKRLLRNEERITEIEKSVISFLDEVDKVILDLNAKNPEILLPTCQQEDVGTLGLSDEDIDHFIPAELKPL